jgi:hypothetical protein
MYGIKTKRAGAVLNLSGQYFFQSGALKGTVSPDYKCLDRIYIKSPWLGHVTPDI